MRNSVPSLCRLEPEIRRASFGAGTCQNSMIVFLLARAGPGVGWWRLQRGRGNEHRAGGDRFHDQYATVPGDRLVGPGGVCLAAAANRQQDFTGTVPWNGDRHPSELAEQAFLLVSRARRALRVHWHDPPAFALIAPLPGIP